MQAEMLASAIDADCLPSLKHLELFGFTTLGRGHISLAKVMGSGRMLALQTLNLPSDNIFDADCKNYANAISSRNLPFLKCLDLSRNRIGIGGIEALRRAIKSGELKNLTEVYLGQNHGLAQESERGYFILAEHLGSSNMRALERLGLEGSGMGDEACKAFKEASSALVYAFSSNIYLAVDLDFDLYDSGFHRRLQQFRKRNLRIKIISAGLVHPPVVPAAFGKDYPCGNLEVGKTTLLRTLQRSLWESMAMWERRPRA